MHGTTEWASWLHAMASMIGLLMYVASTHALHQRRHPAAAMSWILLILFLPEIALPAFLFFGQRKLALRPSIPAAQGAPTGAYVPVPLGWLPELLASFGMTPPRPAPDLRLHADPAQAERALWDIVDGARERLYVCTYLIGRDRMGEQLVERLAARAAQGVDVRLLIDGVGGLKVRGWQVEPVRAAGGKVARAFPPMRRLLHRQSNFRNHRKMVVADGMRLWMGGRNFADEYFAGRRGEPGWVDLTLDVGGDVAADADVVFCGDWELATGERLRPVGAPPASTGRPPRVQLMPSGPDQPQDVLLSVLVTACFRAQTRILAITPYLIPDTSLLQALTLAARRGVVVDLVLPARSNHLLADMARSRPVRELANAGVAVWLSPSMLHAKAVVVDGVALVGSANLDSRSLFLNFELSMLLHEAHDTRQLADWIDGWRRGALRYVPRPPSLARDIAEGAVLWLGFQL